MDSEQHPTASLSREISRGLVALYKEYMGRGPTHVRTSMNPNVVTCIAYDSFTRAEHKLLESGGEDVVLTMRRTFQRAISEEAVALVEGITGRRVVAFMSDHDPAADIAAEIFVLAPDGDEPANDDQEAL